ncbi:MULTISPECIES: response regulator transcription factor [unclassified Clostridium]|uniref:response regulator transcription factor n=1 Tax=unclassified Clostridium TaxID=2614128 RepID=UPI000297646A|nr:MULTISPECIES: response regulator transcription factor [unclassified Clostridium]EKQ56452.1 MAG: response regulator (CheY-like receiver and winged helix DNA-binding domain containing protein) [Clostridium sp. Maddingley MBC34-26]
MNKKLIYIADDEINICNIIKSFLVKEGFDVEIFTDGKSILEAFNKKQADMLILDIMMPEIDGYALCSLIRLKSYVPIIIVSAKDTESDKITGLKLGGDDYLTKPFSPLELIARINSIFRRMDLDKTPLTSSKLINILDVSINFDTKQAEVNGKALNLTVMELSLLSYLIENKNRAVSRSELLDKVWGFENKVETRATDDMIKRIRKKLSDANSILKIATVWGFGFTIHDKLNFQNN